MKKLAHQTSLLVVVASMVTLGGCGGGGSSGSQSYTVGGSVKGLSSGESVVLLDNGGSALTVSTNGPYSFATGLASGDTYSVTVATQPGGQTCTVAQGSGAVGAQAITGVAVTCTDNTYSVGGTIAGLGTASGLVLVNGSDAFPVPAGATNFIMPTAVAHGSSYDVTVQAHPPALNCVVTGGTGTVDAANVASISVSCTAGTVSVLHTFPTGATDGEAPDGSLIQASDGNFYGTTSRGGASSEGTIFTITPAGSETVLHSFVSGTTDGASPSNHLVQASVGNFYGTTNAGGIFNDGTVFKVTSSGTETVLYSFSGLGAVAGREDGADPFGGLIQASDGNFYGTTIGGGANSAGTIFKITPSGTETVLYSFAGGATDGSTPQGGLIQASDGNFYGTTVNGGASNDGTVFRITPAGAETVLYSFVGGTTDGAYPEDSLIHASDGNFYGTTYSGGASDAGTVFKITPSGTETVLYSFAGGAADGASPQGSLLQASDGNFYGTTTYGGASNQGTVFRVTSAGVETVLYSFAGGATDGANPVGSLIQTSNGDFYGTTVYGGANGYGILFVLN